MSNMITYIKSEDKKNNNIVISAIFVKGTVGEDNIFFDGKKQITFIGRSNVGKSSVINALTNKKNLAKSSLTPGKTREMNFFLIDQKFYFVDLPGYGYAKMLPKLADKLRKRIIWYFSGFKIKPLLVILIIDSRIGITKLDAEMLDILENENHKIILLQNKIDKLSKNELNKKITEINKSVSNYKCIIKKIPFSAKTKKGRDELLNEIYFRFNK